MNHHRSEIPAIAARNATNIAKFLTKGRERVRRLRSRYASFSFFLPPYKGLSYAIYFFSMNIEPARAELSNIKIRNYLIALHLRRGKKGYTLHVAIICVCGVSTQQIIIIILIKTRFTKVKMAPPLITTSRSGVLDYKRIRWAKKSKTPFGAAAPRVYRAALISAGNRLL